MYDFSRLKIEQAGTEGRILIVDDDTDLLELIADLVSSLGYRIETASDGIEAADLLKKEDFSILVSDINMPRMDGMELLCYVKKHYPEIDVIMVTGFHSDYGFSDVISAGATDYIAKPFGVDELSAKLKRVFREQRLIRALKDEIREREETEKILKLNEARQAALLKMYEMAEFSSTAAMVDAVLEKIMVLTDSAHGFLGYVSHDQTSIHVRAWYGKAVGQCTMDDGLFKIDIEKGSIWDKLIRQRAPVIINNYVGPDPNFNIHPENPLITVPLLAIPSVEAGRIVAVAAVWDKEKEYSGSDAGQLQLLLDGLWNIVRRKRAEDAYKSALDDLELRVKERTAELAATNEIMSCEITERKLTEKALRKSEADLESRKITLEETNTALKVLLKKHEHDRKEFEERVVANVKELVEPYLDRLRESGLVNRQKTYLDILESNLSDVISPFVYSSFVMNWKLTPAEMKVANLVRFGKSTKEIAEIMNLSPETISVHRKKIRKKSGITNKKVNLRTVLTSLKPDDALVSHRLKVQG